MTTEQPNPNAVPSSPANAGLSAELEREIDAAMHDMAEAMGEQKQPAGKKPGIRGPRVVEGGREHRKGRVVSVGASDVFIEFGPKELGIVELSQYGPDEQPKVGDELEVVVQRFEPGESVYVCVKPGTVQKAEWEMLEPGQVVEARVTGVNKGGLECEVAGHAAFMPASQASLDRIPDMTVLVGEKFPCVVQRVDRRGKGNIVLSRREVLQRERAEAADMLKAALSEGQTVEGTVRKIMPFGAFVDLGGVDGLIHVSDLTHDRVGHGEKAIAKYVSEGQRVTCQILKLDWDGGRISLGIKQLQSDPFQSAAAEIVEGAEVTGKVTKILEFGCFVEVAPGVEGLVHISEIDHRRIARVEDAVQASEVVRVKVLKVDPASRKVSLSIKALKDAPERPAGGGRGGPGGPGGRGRGRGDRDDRTPEEILKETPALRRMREEAQKKAASKPKSGLGGLGGLGDGGGLGIGLGQIKL